MIWFNFLNVKWFHHEIILSYETTIAIFEQKWRSLDWYIVILDSCLIAIVQLIVYRSFSSSNFFFFLLFVKYTYLWANDVSFFFCFYIFYSMFFFLFNLQHYFIIDKSLKLLTKNTDRNESSTTGALIEQGEEIR